MADSTIQIKPFVSGFENNAYLVTEDSLNSGFIVDAPDQPHELIAAVRAAQIKLHFIIITHGHWDHIMGLPALMGEFPDVPIIIGDEDVFELKQYKPPRVIGIVEDIELEGPLSRPLTIKVTPGHTPGSVCYYITSGSQSEGGGQTNLIYHSAAGAVNVPSGVLFSGDTLFPGGPGKTQTQVDFKQITESLEAQVFNLPADTLVLPGHGTTYINIEAALSEYRHFQTNRTGNEYGDVLWMKNFPAG